MESLLLPFFPSRIMKGTFANRIMITDRKWILQNRKIVIVMD